MTFPCGTKSWPGHLGGETLLFPLYLPASGFSAPWGVQARPTPPGAQNRLAASVSVLGYSQGFSGPCGNVRPRYKEATDRLHLRSGRLDGEPRAEVTNFTAVKARWCRLSVGDGRTVGRLYSWFGDASRSPLKMGFAQTVLGIKLLTGQSTR